MGGRKIFNQSKLRELFFSAGLKYTVNTYKILDAQARSFEHTLSIHYCTSLVYSICHQFICLLFPLKYEH